MIEKKKMLYFLLLTIFICITALSLFVRWNQSSVSNSQTSMMDMSMGGMMSMMHAENVTLADLLVQKEKVETVTGQDNHSSHHSESLKELHFLITATIVILLPLIVAGTVFLAAAWFK